GALFTLALAAAGLAAGAVRELGAFGAGIVANWCAAFALAAGYALQFPLRDHESLARRVADSGGEAGVESWGRVAATADPAYAGLAILFLLITFIVIGLRAAGRRIALPGAIAIAVAVIAVAT